VEKKRFLLPLNKQKQSQVGGDRLPGEVGDKPLSASRVLLAGYTFPQEREETGSFIETQHRFLF